MDSSEFAASVGCDLIECQKDHAFKSVFKLYGKATLDDVLRYQGFFAATHGNDEMATMMFNQTLVTERRCYKYFVDTLALDRRPTSDTNTEHVLLSANVLTSATVPHHKEAVPSVATSGVSHVHPLNPNRLSPMLQCLLFLENAPQTVIKWRPKKKR